MQIVPDSPNPSRGLNPEDYSSKGELKTYDADVALVVGSATQAEDFIIGKQWNLLWRDSDMLYQSPRPMSTYENTYVLEPNVQRFTVAKTANAIVPQLYKGLFYADPPMILRPRPGTGQEVVDAKTAMASFLLDECRFKTETKWGFEQMALLGTSIWKWGIEYKKVTTKKRVANTTTIPSGPDGAPLNTTVGLTSAPKIETKTKIVPRPFFEYRPIERVLVDPHTAVGDIRESKFVIDTLYLDYYDIKSLKEGVDSLDEDDPNREGWRFPSDEEILSWWMPPVKTVEMSGVENASEAYGIVHHSQFEAIKVSPDLLRVKKKIYEYWDKDRKIVVIDNAFALFSGKNKFGKTPFLSANWWNRPKSFYGMGLGLIVGQNQRVDQGTINSILKILSFGVNPVYLRQRDSNAPTQMIRTGLGRILTVDGMAKDAYHLMETPKVPGDIWSALKESEQATESASGADQALVQGSTAGPRSSMGRTAGGAGILSNASATRLDGPLDNFIDQVFKPFLYILDELVLEYMPDAEIMSILGQEMGKQELVELQDYHDGVIEFEVLAGASIAAKRTMAQSMTLITQILENPVIQQNLADINEEYIDFKPIINMWLESTEWKNRNDIIKPMTDEMKQKRQAQSEAAMQQSKAAVQQQDNQQKFQQKQVLDDQATDNRIKRDIVREAFRSDSASEAVQGVPSVGGVDGQMPQIA